MKDRDRLMDMAKDFAKRDLELGREPSEEQKLARNRLEKIRNRLYALKMRDEILSSRKLNYVRTWIRQRHCGNLPNPLWGGNL